MSNYNLRSKKDNSNKSRSLHESRVSQLAPPPLDFSKINLCENKYSSYCDDGVKILENPNENPFSFGQTSTEWVFDSYDDSSELNNNQQASNQDYNQDSNQDYNTITPTQTPDSMPPLESIYELGETPDLTVHGTKYNIDRPEIERQASRSLNNSETSDESLNIQTLKTQSAPLINSNNTEYSPQQRLSQSETQFFNISPTQVPHSTQVHQQPSTQHHTSPNFRSPTKVYSNTEWIDYDWVSHVQDYKNELDNSLATQTNTQSTQQIPLQSSNQNTQTSPTPAIPIEPACNTKCSKIPFNMLSYPDTLSLRQSINGTFYLSIRDVFRFVTLGGQLTKEDLMDLGQRVKERIFGKDFIYPKKDKIKVYGSYRNIMNDKTPVIYEVIPYGWEHYRRIARVCLSFAADNAEYIAYY